MIRIAAVTLASDSAITLARFRPPKLPEHRNKKRPGRLGGRGRRRGKEGLWLEGKGPPVPNGGDRGDPPKGSWGQTHIWGLPKTACEKSHCASNKHMSAKRFSAMTSQLWGGRFSCEAGLVGLAQTESHKIFGLAILQPIRGVLVHTCGCSVGWVLCGVSTGIWRFSALQFRNKKKGPFQKIGNFRLEGSPESPKSLRCLSRRRTLYPFFFPHSGGSLEPLMSQEIRGNRPFRKEEPSSIKELFL